MILNRLTFIGQGRQSLRSLCDPVYPRMCEINTCHFVLFLTLKKNQDKVQKSGHRLKIRTNQDKLKKSGKSGKSGQVGALIMFIFEVVEFIHSLVMNCLDARSKASPAIIT